MRRTKLQTITISFVLSILFMLSASPAKAMTAPFLGSWGEGPVIENDRANFTFTIVPRNMRLEAPYPDEAWQKPEIYTLLPKGVQIDNITYDHELMNHVVEQVSNDGQLVRFTFNNSLGVNSNWYLAPEIKLYLSTDITEDRRVYPITKFGSSGQKGQTYPSSGIYFSTDYSNLTNLNDPEREIIFKEVQDLTFTPEVVKVTGITLLNRALEVIAKNRSLELKATVQPENATNKKINWKIKDSDVEKGVAEIVDGKIIGKKQGVVTVIATADDTSAGIHSKSFTLRVTN